MKGNGSKWAWYRARLALMTGAEILHRVRQEIRKRIWRMSYTRLKNKVSGRVSKKMLWRGACWSWDMRAEKKAVLQAAKELFTWTPDNADGFKGHRVRFFGRTFELGNPIQWNHNYRDGVTPPLTWGPGMDYRNAAGVGAVKYIWELNRHHHLVELAKAFYLTGERRYADEVFDQIDSWIEVCPFLKGINWSSSLESAVRVINWCAALEILMSADAELTSRRKDSLSRISRSVYEQLWFIRNYFSLYSSANNHYLGELAGLVVGCLCFDFEESRGWLEEALRELEKQILKQTASDGVSLEQSPAYQTFVFDLCFWAAVLAEKNGFKISSLVWKRLEKMAEFIRALADEHGQVPRIGDDDEGRVLIFSWVERDERFVSLLALSAAHFGRSDFKLSSAGFNEQAYWILGPGGKERYDRAERRGVLEEDFREGGYFVLRPSASRLIMDCGSLGLEPLCAHGHADALSFVLDYKGKSILVDPGIYSYHIEKPWRDYFRSTRAHNALEVDGENQSVIGGNFMWLHKARAELLERSPGLIRARHDGYRRLDDPVIHEREIRWLEEGRRYQIRDRLHARGSHRYVFYFQAHPDCQVKGSGQSYDLVCGDAHVRIVADMALEDPGALHGSEDPIGGWYSPSFNKKVPATTLRFGTTVTGSREFVTTLFLC